MNRNLLLPSVLVLLASCSSSGFYDYRFQPAPMEAQVTTQAVPGAQVRALVTVLGIERGKDKAPDRAIVRMRLENLGTAGAKLELESMSLVTADLQAFGEPSAIGGEWGEIAGGKSEVADIAFPVPAGRHAYDLDVSGLNLRFSVLFGAHRETVGATFRRSDWGYYDPYPRVQFGVGFSGCMH
jgi:hypothetical protein